MNGRDTLIVALEKKRYKSNHNLFGLTYLQSVLTAPPIFELVLRVMRPLMSHITREALEVYGQDKAVWSKRLLDIADKNQLAPDYGGTYKRQE